MTFEEFLKEKKIIVSDGELRVMRPMGMTQRDYKTLFCLDDLEDIFNELVQVRGELEKANGLLKNAFETMFLSCNDSWVEDCNEYFANPKAKERK